jgi:hypothetical protein
MITLSNKPPNTKERIEMKVLKKYLDPQEGDPRGWQPTTLTECLSHTEDAGFWKKGTVKKMLENGERVFTPYAEYSKAWKGDPRGWQPTTLTECF